MVNSDSVFDSVTADRQTHVWQQQLNTALQQLAWMAIDTNEVARFNYYVITSRLDVSQWCGSCCVKPIAVLHLTVDGCTFFDYCTYIYNDNWLWLSGSNVMSWKCVTCNAQFGKVVSHYNIGMGPLSNFVFKQIMLTIEGLPKWTEQVDIFLFSAHP